jgi:hypothetical protein
MCYCDTAVYRWIALLHLHICTNSSSSPGNYGYPIIWKGCIIRFFLCTLSYSVNLKGITGLVDFIRGLKFQILENTTFGALDLFPSSGEGRRKPTLLGPWEKAVTEGNSFIGTQQSICLTPLTWRQKWIEFSKSCVFWYLELRTVRNVLNPSDSEYSNKYLVFNFSQRYLCMLPFTRIIIRAVRT